MKTLAAQIYESPLPPSRHRPELDPFLEALVMRCLEKDAMARYPDAGALDHALASCGVRHPWTQADAEHWWLALGRA